MQVWAAQKEKVSAQSLGRLSAEGSGLPWVRARELAKVRTWVVLMVHSSAQTSVGQTVRAMDGRLASESERWMVSTMAQGWAELSAELLARLSDSKSVKMMGAAWVLPTAVVSVLLSESS